MHKSEGYPADRYTRGLNCDIYRPADGTDSTKYGVSSRHARCLLVGPAIVNGPFSVEDAGRLGYPVLFQHSSTTRDGRVYYYASPDPGNNESGHPWFMFGGNFLYSPDSRFPGGCPMAIHDRRE